MTTVSVEVGRLDDIGAITAGDPGEMLRAVATSAAQVRSGATAAAEADISGLAADGRPRAVVLTGMGTAALAGDVLAALALPTCRIPVVTSSGYSLPGWVGAADLVVALSSSGATEETLVATEEAARRGARVVGIGAPGSPLADRTERARGLFVPVPPGHSPRASFWTLATPLVALGGALGLMDLPPSAIEATAERLYTLALTCQPSSESFVNPAKDLALRLAGTVPVACGTSAITAVAARRLARQWAGNAKAPAMATALPEAAHGELATLDGSWAGTAEDVFADPIDEGDAPTRLALVLLRDPDADRRIAAQADALRAVVLGRGGITELAAEGASAFERLASVLGLIDFASVYLALLTGTDPSPTPTPDAVRAASLRALVPR